MLSCIHRNSVCALLLQKKGKFPFSELDYSNFSGYFLAIGIKLP